MGLAIFRCDKRSLTLSTAGCSRLYASANGPKRPEPYEGRAACVACPIGAYHLTGRQPSAVALLAEALRMICPRCGRPASRLIWGLMCASCDARQREAVAGSNAKHTRPALSDQLHTQRIAVSTGSDMHRQVSRSAVASLPEVIIHHSKTVTGPTAYGRRRLQWDGIPQLEFGL